MFDFFLFSFFHKKKILLKNLLQFYWRHQFSWRYSGIRDVLLTHFYINCYCFLTYFYNTLKNNKNINSPATCSRQSAKTIFIFPSKYLRNFKITFFLSLYLIFDIYLSLWLAILFQINKAMVSKTTEVPKGKSSGNCSDLLSFKAIRTFA